MDGIGYAGNAAISNGVEAYARKLGFSDFNPYSAADRLGVLASVAMHERLVAVRSAGKMIELALLANDFVDIWDAIVPEDLQSELGLCVPVAYNSFQTRGGGRRVQNRQEIMRVFPEHAVRELIEVTDPRSEVPKPQAVDVMRLRYETIAAANVHTGGMLYKFLERLKGTRRTGGQIARQNQATLYPLLYAAADSPEHLSRFLKEIPFLVGPDGNALFSQWRSRPIEGDEFAQLEELVEQTT